MKAYTFRTILTSISTLSLVLFPATFTLANDTFVGDVRSAYQKAHEKADSFNKFHALVGEYGGSDPLLLAYKASAIALKGKFAISPVSKVKYAKTALSQLDSLISKHTTNVEIVFLRLAIEHNIPSFLNMSSHIEQDKEVIISYLPSYSRVHINMSNFMIASLIDFGLISEEDAASLKTNPNNE